MPEFCNASEATSDLMTRLSIVASFHELCSKLRLYWN